jgi:corrinoid protein of di/trimethylamine methyltransferase
MATELLLQIRECVIKGDQAATLHLVQQALESGIGPMQIIEEGLTPGMHVVGDKFSCGEYFIPHLVMAARAMQAAMKLVEPELKKRQQAVEGAGTAVIGTVHGDIHEIGKSLVGVMLSANGFEVHDLGVNVPVESFVAKVQETGANLVGLSSLLTTTMVVQRQVIQAFEAAGIRDKVKIMVGGAPVKQGWASEIGADGYAEDATGAVELAKALAQAG